MLYTYSIHGYVDMICLYGFCNGNISPARNEYVAQFPNRKLPNKIAFFLKFQRLRETGSFNMVLRADESFAPLQTERRSAIILQHFNQNPPTNIRRSGSELGISRHSYHLQRVQYLLPADMLRWKAFCSCF
ncbi:hypothetical protein X777_06674 [Ooceraea biroi]|uniref:DUF4817 domain-containing protein n=1 Tax=Ooceraea biroi TaxID=2015173 RepID=A0A026WCV8_OOCBI|nr:hypothetical protein X777_06674 [Ooceraea biroi]